MWGGAEYEQFDNEPKYEQFDNHTKYEQFENDTKYEQFENDPNNNGEYEWCMVMVNMKDGFANHLFSINCPDVVHLLQASAVCRRKSLQK